MASSINRIRDFWTDSVSAMDGIRVQSAQSKPVCAHEPKKLFTPAWVSTEIAVENHCAVVHHYRNGNCVGSFRLVLCVSGVMVARVFCDGETLESDAGRISGGGTLDRGAVMGLLAGFITDAVWARTHDLRKARTYLAALGQFVFGLAILATLLAQSIVTVAILLFIAEGFNELSASIFQVIPVDTLAERAGSATGWVFLLAQLMVTLSPLLTGAFLIHGNYFLPAFLVAGILPLVGGVVLLTMVYPGHLNKPLAETKAGL